MKKRNILLTAFTAIFAFSASMAVAFGGIKSVSPSVQAANNDNAYWEQYFDVESEGSVAFESQTQLPSYITSINTPSGSKSTGLGVIFNKETTITYKQPVLVNSLTDTNSLVEYYPAPAVASTKAAGKNSEAGDAEFSTVIIRLENYDDPSQFIEIKHFRSGFDVSLSWALVRTNTMDYAGIKKGQLDPTKDKGTPLNGCFTGVNNIANGFYYDSAKNVILAAKPLYSETSYGYAYGTIRELANGAHLTGGDDAFIGFDSKYVRLSLTFSNVTVDDADSHIILTKILGQSLTDTTFVDSVKPMVSFTNEYKIDKVPNGEKGTFYPLWDIEGYDAIDGIITDKLTYDIKYLGLDGLQAPTTNGVTLGDGGFTPTETGIYQVTTNLQDAAGNAATPLVVNVKVLPIVETLNINFAGGATIPTTTSVGQRVVLPEYSISGGSGNVKVDFSVTYNNRTVDIEVINNAFEVVYAGVYNVTYILTDYLGDTRVFDYPISSALSTKPIISDVVFPTIAKADNDINLNMPKAYDFASFPGQKIEVPVVMEARNVKMVNDVEEADATWTVVEANSLGKYVFSPAYNAVKVEVRYKASPLISAAGSDVVTEPRAIKIYAPETLVDYWYNADGNITTGYQEVADGSGSIENYFTINQKGATLEYLNPLQSESFSLGLNFEPGSSFFNKITITLTDSENIDEVLTIALSERSDDTVFVSTVSNNYASTTGIINRPESISSILLKFKLVTQLIDATGTTISNITKFDSGAPFNGFSSGRIFVKITFNDFETEDNMVNKIRFTEFYSQYSYFEEATDIARPVISPATHIATYYSYLDKVEIPAATAYDLYSPNVITYVTVTSPSNQVLVSKTIANKPTSIILSENGKYTIEYTATDECGMRRSLTFNMFTLDVIKPVIEINGQIKTKVKVGEVLKLPEYYATDNFNKPEDILRYIYLETPTFGYKTIAIGDNYGTYKFQVAGTYNLVYFAMDKASNYVYKTFTITVTD